MRIHIDIDTKELAQKSKELGSSAAEKSLDLSIAALKHTKKGLNRLQRFLKEKREAL